MSSKPSSPINRVTPSQAHRLQSEGAALVDVREPAEHAQGMAIGAQPLPLGEVPAKMAQVEADKSRKILLLCAHGIRSLAAAQTLSELGYRDVYSVDGGFVDWQAQDLPWAVPEDDAALLSQRYARQMSLPEVGLAGQRKLAAARVAIVGAGGLGSPAALYLAGAGVGQLGLIDHDVVERSNLHRQVVHKEATIGHAKTASAKAHLEALNPDIEVRAHEQKLCVDNVETLFSEYDLILDGSDNFPTRYLVNDACCKLGLVNISAAVQRFEGQLSVFAPGGPCYRCLFPEPPLPENAPSCSEAGVLGVVPGILGLLQALEAIKIIVGLGQPLTGRLLVFDAKTSGQRILQFNRDPDCNYCDSSQAFPGYIDYPAFCGL